MSEWLLFPSCASAFYWLCKDQLLICTVLSSLLKESVPQSNCQTQSERKWDRRTRKQMNLRFAASNTCFPCWISVLMALLVRSNSRSCSVNFARKSGLSVRQSANSKGCNPIYASEIVIVPIGGGIKGKQRKSTNAKFLESQAATVIRNLQRACAPEMRYASGESPCWKKV